jgi:hypothetical protein
MNKSFLTSKEIFLNFERNLLDLSELPKEIFLKERNLLELRKKSSQSS